MINDISEILNFRYHKKFLTAKWYGSPLPGHILKNKKILQEPPSIYNHFEYVLHEDLDIHINKQSKTKDVFCDCHSISLVVELINRYPVNYNNLIIMGADTHLSQNLHLLKLIKHHFKKIYYEAKDVECDWVQTLPMGMIMAYMLRTGGNDILQHINKRKNKTKLVCTMFGSKYAYLTKKIKNRHELKVYAKDNDFVDDMLCDPLDYYERLCEYKFLLTPHGRGIQTPKICESIMCETVPVVTDHVTHRELRDLFGLPLLIVNDWSDLTEQFLNDQWNAVYSKIDWNNQKSKFLVSNFYNLLQKTKCKQKSAMKNSPSDLELTNYVHIQERVLRIHRAN